jgi:hypothetical protein
LQHKQEENKPLQREETMTKVSPYHTNSNEYAAHQREVYHDHDNCPAGKHIKPQHKQSGTANRPRCKDCVKLG